MLFFPVFLGFNFFFFFIEKVLAKQVANLTDLKQCTPNQLKLPKHYHVNLIENKWRMAC